MPETPEKSEKKLSVPSKPLSLKGRGVESGMVRQAFSHGRTKTVVVEKVKSRALGKPKLEPAPAPEKVVPKRPVPSARPGTVTPAAAPGVVPAQTAAVAPKPSGMVL